MKVKNKQPADRQITAEQILRESKDIQLEDGFTAPKQIITDPEELAEYRLKKRKEFEDNARRVGRFQMTVWFKVSVFMSEFEDGLHPAGMMYEPGARICGFLSCPSLTEPARSKLQSTWRCSFRNL